VNGHDVISLQPLPSQRVNHAIVNKFCQRRVIDMLKLTAPAKRKMAARRVDVVGTMHQASTGLQTVTRRCHRHVTTIGHNAIATCSQSNDKIIGIHKLALPKQGKKIKLG
jgi:hypothetical protein